MAGLTSIEESAISHSGQEGILVSPGAKATVALSQLIFNTGAGLSVSGAGAEARISRSLVISNGVGLSNVSGVLESTGKNVVRGNGNSNLNVGTITAAGRQ